jgi:hypothetical protein
MPTIRISDLNYQRLQQFAVPLEDTPNDALGRVLDLAELAKQSGLSIKAAVKTANGSLVTLGVDRLDTKLAAKLSGIAYPVKEGNTMTRWEYERTGNRFWITKSGTPRVYLPPRGSWPSDTDHKVVHHPTPKSGWDRYDHLNLRDEGDVDYALKVLEDLGSPLVPNS